MRVGQVRPYANQPQGGKTEWRGTVELLHDDGQWMMTIETSLISGSKGYFLGLPSRKVQGQSGGPDEYINTVRMSMPTQEPIIEAITRQMHGSSPGGLHPSGTTPSPRDEFAQVEAEFGKGF